MFERQGWMQRAGDYPKTDRRWNELLARAIMSAGLGPKVVEGRWATMSELFYQWEPGKVAAMTELDETMAGLYKAELICKRGPGEA